MFKARMVMNAVFLLVVLLNLFSWFILPDNVAIHFNASGTPDGWAPGWFHIVSFTVLMAVLYASFALAPRLLEEVPAKYVSLPNRDYWLQDENRPEAVRRMSNLMHSFGAVTGLLMLAVLIMLIKANLSDQVRLPGRLMWIMMIAYFSYMAWWLVRIFTAFRIPK